MVVIMTMMATVIMAWSSIDANIENFSAEVERLDEEKANKDVMETNFQYIKEELIEIKEMIREK
jgi:Tfp pilus assembly protein PilO